ncbi:MAG: glycine/sarcosine/betaine reductase selenoprotein B family protein [Acidimicrobiales bacterium]
MTERRRTHRSHLSYIDKSREYYAAHGYEKAYEWATNDDAPFTPLSKPLSECKVGAITTSYFLPEDFVYRIPSDLPRKPHVAARSEVERLNNQHLSWAKDETHTEDPESFLPLARLDEAAAAGRIGSVSDRFYCLPTQFSHRQTQRRDTPQLIEWLQEDEVDVVLMIPL